MNDKLRDDFCFVKNKGIFTSVIRKPLRLNLATSEGTLGFPSLLPPKDLLTVRSSQSPYENDLSVPDNL